MHQQESWNGNLKLGIAEYKFYPFKGLNGCDEKKLCVCSDIHILIASNMKRVVK